ncbi:hypothetical protein [Vulgatibacter sp.]|uniref:hypothetical protein n=1 Tax=Vulgatibacter sp. TaxID=1971226 RepID=UPI003567E436
MGLKERRADAEATLRSAQRAAESGEPVPERTLAAGGYAFLLAELDLHLSILGQPIAPLDLAMPELRGKLQALAGSPPYRTEALAEAFTYPVLVRGPEGDVSEAYLYQSAEGAMLGGDEAKRPDWEQVVQALARALDAVRPADFEDKVYDPDASAWIYYGVRRGEPFEDMVEGEDPPEWAE